ncbi:MAG: hypothetical protein Q9159_002508 [Coniocarpon cinnabarinum]
MCRKEWVTHLWPNNEQLRQPYVYLCGYSQNQRPCPNTREYEGGVIRHRNPRTSGSSIPSVPDQPPSALPPGSSGRGHWERTGPNANPPRPPPIQTQPVQHPPGSRIPVANQGHQHQPRASVERAIVLEQPQAPVTSRTRRESGRSAPTSPEVKRRSINTNTKTSPTSKPESAYRKKNGQYTPPSTETNPSQQKRPGQGVPLTVHSPPRSAQNSPPAAEGQAADMNPEVSRAMYRTERRAQNQQSWGSAASAGSAGEFAELTKRLAEVEEENRRLKTERTVEYRLSHLEERIRDRDRDQELSAATKKRYEGAKQYIGEVRSPTTPRQERYHHGDREELFERQTNRRSGEGQTSRLSNRRSDERTSTASNRGSIIDDEPQQDLEVEESSHRRRRKREGKRKEERRRH